MIEINVKADIKDAVRYLDNVQRKQIPFATSVALNETAKDVQYALSAEMRVFDRPKPATRKGTYLKRSDKRTLSAVVGLKTRTLGTPVSEYLDAQVEGGSREYKRSEILLQRAGILPAGYQTRPGSGAKFDAYGNMSRGQIVQILSFFKTFGGIKESGRYKGRDTQSQKLNRSRKRAAVEYFVVPDGMPGLATGIWRRLGRNIDPVLIFIKDATYRKRYDFYGVANKVARNRIGIEFDAALRRALATAR